ncbi:MAG: fasciclin domain-containing protein [Actinomycetota bacterium]|nr:fasciclin domain-containing protein [Actinomycetota bacterium]
MWDILDASPDLSDARDYVEQAGLRDLLDDQETPVTLLAPTNDAFDRMEERRGGSDLLDDDERLRELLERHIVEDRVLFEDLFADDELETIGGDVLAVDPDDETIEDASVLAPDVEEGNGVVHAIDRVLRP